MSSLKPPARFADASFEGYRPRSPDQAAARDAARAFAEHLRDLHDRPDWQKLFRKRPLPDEWSGLYLVGPVGTGKTHLLAAIYHALHPEVPCAFMHASALFRSTEHPETFARRLARRYHVLCLDEMEIDDAANEARLVLVLKTLQEHRVVLFATSNVEPERFLSSAFGTHRFERFLREEFRQRYRVLFVGGADYRRHLEKPGCAWIGAPEATRPQMRRAFEEAPVPKRWVEFAELIRLATEVEHTALVSRLLGYRNLFLADLAPHTADDALRLLRIMDDLYFAEEPPRLFFTSATPPDEWFDVASRRGIERGVAEKFARTTSRLTGLCEVEYV